MRGGGVACPAHFSPLRFFHASAAGVAGLWVHPFKNRAGFNLSLCCYSSAALISFNKNGLPNLEKPMQDLATPSTWSLGSQYSAPDKEGKKCDFHIFVYISHHTFDKM